MKRCYICFEDTEYQSECECNSYICKNCLEKEIEYRKGQCSICRSKIINKDFISLEIKNDNTQNNNQNNTWCNNLQYMILCSIFLSVYITIIFLGGNLINIIILKKNAVIIFNLFTFVLGILFYLLLLLCIIITYGILSVIYLLFLSVRDIFK